jgi:predicted nucleic acid-binding protein
VPAFTVEAVVSECLFLLRRNRLDPQALFSLLETGVVAIEPGAKGDTPRLVRLCRTYGDVPMSWADASLVALSEKHPKAQLMTFDSDFTVYRRFGTERLPLVQPLSVRR